MLMQSVRLFTKTMASTESLSRLRQNAADADRIVSELKEQLLALKQTAASRQCQAESQRLMQENVLLRSEVNKLKQELVALEVQHGVLQVPMPVSCQQKPSTSAATTTPTPGATTTPTPGATTTPTPAAAATTPTPGATTTPTPAAAATTTAAKTVSNNKQKAGNQSPASETARCVSDPSTHKTTDAVQGNATKTDKRPVDKQSTNCASDGASEGGVDVSRLNMRIGQIVSVKKHPDADSLYVEEVNVGEGKHRTVVSGLVKHVPLDQMQDRIAVFLLNLKPAKMRGVMSEAMIMCASSPDKVEIIVPPAGVAIGDRVTVDGYPGAADDVLNPKKKVWEQIQPDLRINSTGQATYKGSLWRVEGKAGDFRAATMTDSAIR